VWRKEIKNAPYNPRKISKYARAKLKKVLKDTGLIEALVWNRRTGNAVGGHQRLACIDALEGSQDYELDVNMVDMSPAEEVAANISLNNLSLQGDWDLPLLASALKTEDLNIEATGFGRMDLEVTFGDQFNDPDISRLFADSLAPPEVRQDIALLEAAADLRPSKASDKPAEATEPTEADSAGPAPEEPPKRRAHDNLRDWIAQRDAQQDTDFSLGVIFDSKAAKDRFVAAVEGESTKYIDGMRLAVRFGIELGSPEPNPTKPGSSGPDLPS